MTLNHSASTLLDQIDNAISQLDDHQYKQPIETLSQASIGQHVRHTLEFFICLLDARNHARVNYDDRKRDNFIEEEVSFARSVIKSIKNFLNEKIQAHELILEANYEIDGNQSVEIPTTFHRELAYNIEHAIHHMALIKIGMKSAFPDVILADHFGVASSTVRYQKGQGS